MRTRHIVRAVAPLGLVIAALIAPTPVAATHTTNLAGRPMGNSASTACHGLVYGMVDSRPVLFTADHCHQGAGAIAYGVGNERIGVWGPRNVAGSGANDLAFIWLDSGKWPTYRNRVYRGAVAGNDYWTMTAQPYATSGISCTDWNDSNPEGGKTIYHNFQYSNTGTLAYRTGNANGYDYWSTTRCGIITNLQYHGEGWKDSGSPFILTGRSNTIFGIATYHLAGWLVIANTRGGFVALNSYYQSVGTHTGVRICTSSTAGAC